MNEMSAGKVLGEDATLELHAAENERITDCPLVEGNAVQLLPGGMIALSAMWQAIAAATDHVHMEYYTFADITVEGRTISDLLHEKLRQGVRVAITYDAFGSQDTPDSLIDWLEQAGARTLEFHPLNPLKRHYVMFRANDRDHRKILVVDGRVAFLGGVNLSHVYENPEGAGTGGGHSNRAFWLDAAVRIEGPSVAEIQKLFLETWDRQGGDRLDPKGLFPPLAPAGQALIRAAGSAPRERRQLFYDSMHVAVRAARHRILMCTGYFVPTTREWLQLALAARRGVQVDLLLPGFSDVSATVAAARALYGRLMKRGVRIHEVRGAVLHAKVATIDGVWTAIGSSNYDHRSYAYNNEVDAIILDRATADDIRRMLEGWMADAKTISYEEWRQRSRREHLAELMARLWKRLM